MSAPLVIVVAFLAIGGSCIPESGSYSDFWNGRAPAYEPNLAMKDISVEKSPIRLQSSFAKDNMSRSSQLHSKRLKAHPTETQNSQLVEAALFLSNITPPRVSKSF